jgi:hypothetical protein
MHMKFLRLQGSVERYTYYLETRALIHYLGWTYWCIKWEIVDDLIVGVEQVAFGD